MTHYPKSPSDATPPGNITLERKRHTATVLLALNSGVTDAMGFVGLGGVFTSVMTGNLVLLGVSASSVDGPLALRTVSAIISYVVGAGIGARIVRHQVAQESIWPSVITRALTIEFIMFAIFFAGWVFTAGHPNQLVQLGLLMVNAMALGIQSSAVNRFGVPGLSTTYLTGTLTTVVIRLMTGQRLRDVRQSIEILCAMVVGAIVGAFITTHLRMAAPALQLILVGSTLIIARMHFHRAQVGPNPD